MKHINHKITLLNCIRKHKLYSEIPGSLEGSLNNEMSSYNLRKSGVTRWKIHCALCWIFHLIQFYLLDLLCPRIEVAHQEGGDYMHSKSILRDNVLQLHSKYKLSNIVNICSWILESMLERMAVLKSAANIKRATSCSKMKNVLNLKTILKRKRQN